MSKLSVAFYAILAKSIRESDFGEVIKRAYSGLHKIVFQISGGRVWAKMRGAEIILLTTTGCKSGEKRTQPLNSLKINGRYCIVGTNAGGPKDPAWVSNLAADPHASVKLPGGSIINVRSRRVADAVEWEAIYQRFIQAHDGYAVYLQTTDRKMPIFTLEEL
jgi:deazaflavin-dependent oxidoreductase (nitroreductase family)